jgi:signal peptidase I
MALAPPARAHAKPKETPKEALIGLIISFVVVLIYRGFIFETFHIPTGSMAPTLRGAHMQFTSPQSGTTWAVNPWTDNRGVPTNPQGSASNPVRVSDPVTGAPIQPGTYPLRSGDRIAVLKYNWLHHPKRWDVIVFKFPENPRENYIKRLVGLPNEDLWLVDGDVFVRERRAGEPSPSPLPQEGGESGGWRIARKPAYIQDDVWWTIHSSERSPLRREFDGVAWRSPWQGRGWSLDDRGVFTTESAGATLAWDSNAWPITDFAAYNQITPWAPNRRDNRPGVPVYPTSDLRVRAGVEPSAPDATVRMSIEANEHRYTAEIKTGGVRYSVEPVSEAGADPIVLNASGFGGFPVGVITDVEFLHVDQSLEVRINGETHGRMTYDWSPVERLRNATRLTDEQLDAVFANDADTSLSNPNSYTLPQVSIDVESAGAVALHRVGLDRDLFYQPAMHFGGSRAGAPGLGSHPAHLARMGGNEFFAAGDNSASSRDSRLWDNVSPWVLDQTGAQVGMVPGDMLMGEAVVVFWPAPNVLSLGPIRLPFVPDIGRMRLIK